MVDENSDDRRDPRIPKTQSYCIFISLHQQIRHGVACEETAQHGKKHLPSLPPHWSAVVAKVEKKEKKRDNEQQPQTRDWCSEYISNGAEDARDVRPNLSEILATPIFFSLSESAAISRSMQIRSRHTCRRATTRPIKKDPLETTRPSYISHVARCETTTTTPHTQRFSHQTLSRGWRYPADNPKTPTIKNDMHSNSQVLFVLLPWCTTYLCAYR